MTITANAETITAEIFVTEYLGDGNWEVEAPNGMWTITADTDDEATATVFHISHDDNHHQPEGWEPTLADAQAWLRANGVDRRRKA